MKNLIRLTLAIIATIIVANGVFAQTPEWVEYCRLRDEINHNDSTHLAYMIDRDLMNRGLPQLYGTQYIGVYTDNNTMENMLWPVENMEQLNARREHMLLAPMDTTGLKVYDENAIAR
jgi:hypothetical protein